MTEHAIEIVRPSPRVVTMDTAALTDAFFGGKSPRTIAAYRQDLAAGTKLTGRRGAPPAVSPVRG